MVHLKVNRNQVDNSDHGSIGSGNVSPLRLESNINFSDNGVVTTDTIPKYPDNNDSNSSNKLENLLDEVSTDMEQTSITSVPPSPYSPFCKQGETKTQYSSRTSTLVQLNKQIERGEIQLITNR